jgi:predicted P-loop ATPase
MTQNKMLKCALYYAKSGLAVFPLKPKSKMPIYPGGFKIATTDTGTITEWWTKHPSANIGIATGVKSGGMFVIDLDKDSDKGIDGYETLTDWERDNGDLPDTANTITGRGGYHLLYKTNKTVKSRAGLYDGIDIRGDGGYIVAPPSIHNNGNEYQWEQTLAEYGISEANNTVFKFLKGTSETEQTEALMVPAEIRQGGRNDMMYRVACALQAKGLDDSTIIMAVKSENEKKCFPPLEEEELLKTIKSALSQDKGKFKFNKPRSRQYISLIQTKPNKDGETKHKQCAENIATVIRQDEDLAGKIKYDLISYAPKYFGQLPWRKPGDTMGEWDDFDDSNLRAYLDTNFGLKNKGDYDDGFNIVLNENKFNPIIDYLEALPEWDGIPRIENLLFDFLGVPKDDYSLAVMNLFMQGAINRAYHPGCKFDYMLVIVGEQGIGKSTFLRELALNEMWFDDNFNTVEGNQAIERLRGKWILELAELLAVKKQKEVESIKAFITAQVDNYREPYARRTTARKRCCVFAATTNDYTFLTDRTGNRRYMPVTADKRNRLRTLFDEPDYIHRFFRQAWAEALHIYKTERPRLVLSKNIAEEAIKRQQNYLEEDPWVGIIQLYLDNTMLDKVCAMNIWHEALKNDSDPKRHESNRIHTIMRNEVVGWEYNGKSRCGEYGSQRAYVRKIENGMHKIGPESDSF